MFIFFIDIDIFLAAPSGQVEMLEALLFLCAEMENGFALLLPMGPHGKVMAMSANVCKIQKIR